MRIALLNDSFPPTIDGVANAVLNYARVLTEMGHSVIVATPAYPGAQDAYDYPVLRYRSLDTTRLIGYRAGFPFSVRAVEELRDFAPDVIHSHCPVSSNLLARTLREATGAPVVFTYHTKFDIDIRAALRGELLQNGLINALVRNIEPCDEVWTVSEGAGANLCSLGYTGRFRVMENGVDMPCGRAPEADIALVRARHGLRPETPVFLFTGRLRWYKGLRLIVEGLARARQTGEDFRMIFVGDGSDRAEVEALCRESGIASLCVFTGAVRDRALLRAYYSAADLFLFPSTFDTNGIVVREAAACALPALLVRDSCAAEGVTEGQNGLLMREDAASLCTQALYACRNREALRRIGENAQKQLYVSWEEAVRRAAVRYEEILGAPISTQRRRHDVIPFINDCVEGIIRLHEWQQTLRGKTARRNDDDAD